MHANQSESPEARLAAVIASRVEPHLMLALRSSRSAVAGRAAATSSGGRSAAKELELDRSVAGGSGFLAPDLSGRREDAACPLGPVKHLDQLIIDADERFRGYDGPYPRIEQRRAPIIGRKHEASARHAGAVHGLVGLLRGGQQGLVARDA